VQRAAVVALLTLELAASKGSISQNSVCWIVGGGTDNGSDRFGDRRRDNAGQLKRVASQIPGESARA
jgi:hypothetical protein